jgi:aminoglycoside 2'-N-acetyltransferase I
VTRLVVAETSAVNNATLAAARALLVEVFEGEFTSRDWEHALGGVHAFLWDRQELIGHASIVPRRALLSGKARRTGHVESVGVRSDQRGRGHGSTLMDAIEEVIRQEYNLGALGASEQAKTFYAARGWRPWRGRLSVLTAIGVESLGRGNGSVHVFTHGVPVDVTGELTCEWREGELW